MAVQDRGSAVVRQSGKGLPVPRDSREGDGHYETGNPLGTASRYAIRPSRPPAFTAGTERTYGPGHAAHEGGKACEDLCPVGGKPCGDLSSDGGKGSDHRHTE